MAARRATRRLIDELKRETILETQANLKKVVPATQEVRSKTTELKMIHQLKATDRPADVKAKLKKRAESLLRKLARINDAAKRMLNVMPDDTIQLIKDIESCSTMVVVWINDVEATATQIVEKFNDLRQEDITLRNR